MLEVINLTKIFEDKKTKSRVGIEDINFSASKGRILGLIGANGAGKTTTMRIIADLIQPDSGEVKLDGVNLDSMKDLKKKVSFVSPETQLYDRMTTYEILYMFGTFADIPDKEVKTRIDDIADRLGMKDFLHRQTAAFSTGMKQKVSFARALITNPDILVFDEVTNGLDIFASREVKDMILELKDDNRIVLYSTHIMPDADEICDDLVFIHKGQVMAKGTKQEIKSKYNKDSIEDIFFYLVKETQN